MSRDNSPRLAKSSRNFVEKFLDRRNSLSRQYRCQNVFDRIENAEEQRLQGRL